MTYIRVPQVGDESMAFITAWLQENGCRHYVALEPIIVKGNIIEVQALCRVDPKAVQRLAVDPRTGEFRARTIRLRQRVKLHEMRWPR